MNAHVKPIDTEQRDFFLAALRCSYLRVKLIENEIASVGVALKDDLISPDAAVLWTDEIGLEELDRRAELRRQEEFSAILATMEDHPFPLETPTKVRPYLTPQSTIDAFSYVVSLKDPDQLESWLERHPSGVALLRGLLGGKNNA
jgi:hypothetical protein